jgi:hypothetical protein
VIRSTHEHKEMEDEQKNNDVWETKESSQAMRPHKKPTTITIIEINLTTNSLIRWGAAAVTTAIATDSSCSPTRREGVNIIFEFATEGCLFFSKSPPLTLFKVMALCLHWKTSAGTNVWCFQIFVHLVILADECLNLSSPYHDLSGKNSTLLSGSYWRQKKIYWSFWSPGISEPRYQN